MTQRIAPHPILSLADAHHESLVGGKAASLQRLLSLGVRVPRGIVITAPHVATIQDEIIPDSLWAAIRIAWLSLRAQQVIVRSSAVGEDSKDASFAGQLDSIPDVSNEDQLRSAILRCRASAASDRVLAYERSRGHRLAGLAIIVQEQIASSIAGVLFTVDPGGSEGALIEYCAGAGEALVSGRVNPGRLSVSAAGEVRHYAHSEDVVLDEAAARDLAEHGSRLARHFGAPQDIEWTIDGDGRCWLVQARPITAVAARLDAEPVVVWSNANVNENFPEPISPLLYSVAAEGYYHYFRNLGRAFGLPRRTLEAIDVPLRHVIGVHAGRMYYNLTNIHTALQAAPFGDQLTASFNQFVGTNELPPPRDPRIPRPTDPRTPRLTAARIAASVAWQYAFLPGRVKQFERRADAFAASSHPSILPRFGRRALLERLRGFMEIRCHHWKNASLADAAAMVCYAGLKACLRRHFPSEDQEALHNTLLKALPDLVSAKPALELWTLSRLIRSNPRLTELFASGTPESILETVRSERDYEAFRRKLNDYQENWGFRCSAELMLTVPSFQEDPRALVPLLRAYAQSDAVSPETQLARQRDERLRETRRVLRASGPVKALVLRVLLLWTQRSIQLRERARLKQALLYTRLRRIALSIGTELASGGFIDRPDEVFMLTVEEIDRLLSGTSMFPALVRDLTRLRRSAHEAFREMRPPDTLRLPYGVYFTGSERDDSSATSDRLALTGTSACGGRATARATVLADVTEAHRLAAGDILVTRQTDPGWGPVFPLISGLVMERGGMLSHGAIIAREFGIPSVVGVSGATQLIPPGALVCLDGDRGTVRLMPEVA
jgi:pyruvate,water dikinase